MEEKYFWKIYDKMIESAQKDEEAANLLKSMYQKAEDYVAVRRMWNQMSEAEICRRDSDRRELHDLFIFSFNELIQYIELQTKENDWKKITNDRKSAGDFAEYIVRKKETIEERLDILGALSWALKYQAQVMFLINESRDTKDAKNKMVNQYGFHDRQAQAIIDMRLRAFTLPEKEKLAKEISEYQRWLDMLG